MVSLLLKLLFSRDMKDILVSKTNDLIFYAKRFDDYCGYEALIILLVIAIFSCQVFSLIPPLSQQFGVIVEVVSLLTL